MKLLEEGQNILGTYEVERFLGEGAFAEVYRVRHRFLGRQAMKVFKAVGMTAAEVDDALGEAALLSRIGHPNIVRVFDANIFDGDAGSIGFFTMEYVAGGSLADFWRAHGARFVPVETAVEIGRQICRGLAVAHRESPPVVHRDIKPQNVLVGYDAGGLRAVVSDFGLARRVNPLTLLASARGTLGFKAPEALLNAQSDSTAGDVWALGATLYLLLTDASPYSGETDDPRALARTYAVRDPAELNALVDPALGRVLLRALAPEPDVRHRDAAELLADLSDWTPVPPKPAIQSRSSLDPSKSALGERPAGDDSDGYDLARLALSACEEGRLVEAADLMERAITHAPDLRNRYEHRLTLWRKGIAM